MPSDARATCCAPAVMSWLLVPMTMPFASSEMASIALTRDATHVMVNPEPLDAMPVV